MNKYILCSLIVFSPLLSMDTTENLQGEIDALMKTGQYGEAFDLLDKQTEASKQQHEQFEYCLENGNEDTALEMIKKGFSISHEYEYLALAARKGRVKVILKMIESVDINHEEERPLFREKVKNKPRPPLADAIEGDQPATVELLLANSASTGIRFLASDYWTTPLSLAKRLDRKTIIAILKAAHAEESEEYIEKYSMHNRSHNPEREAMQNEWRK